MDVLCVFPCFFFFFIQVYLETSRVAAHQGKPFKAGGLEERERVEVNGRDRPEKCPPQTKGQGRVLGSGGNFRT